jgi:hypothetical protein
MASTRNGIIYNLNLIELFVKIYKPAILKIPGFSNSKLIIAGKIDSLKAFSNCSLFLTP